VERAGIPDLAVQDLVRLREGVESDSRATGGAAADRQGVAAVSLSILESDVRHVENVEAATANNRLNFRIDEFTNHLIYSKESVCICEQHWLEANQCLTARVYA